ncbi:MAG: hypothetical protein Q9167_000433 [Letrouitia subvulpina]
MVVIIRYVVEDVRSFCHRTSSWGSVGSDKPLPEVPEPTKLQKLADYLKTTLRALGLNLFVYFFKRYYGFDLDERPKIAFHRNRGKALFRSLIHVLPFTVAMIEIIINWRGWYLGADVDGLSYFQFAAKLHEMAMQSSLAVIVFSYMRSELFSGSGLPIGAMLSGLQLTQVSYLWSMELWGIGLSTLSIRRKLGIMAMIVLAVLLASTAGPSSAVLMIPRLGYWPAGSTHIWMNITSEGLWPSNVDGSLVPASCSQAPNISNACPSSEWKSMHEFFTLSNQMIPNPYMGGFSVTPYSVQVTGRTSLRQLIIQHQYYKNMSAPYDHQAAKATSQHAAVADALSTTGSLWSMALEFSGSKFSNLRDGVQTISNSYYQPYTLASCGSDVIEGREDDRPVSFPIPPGSSPAMLSKANISMELPEMMTITYPGIDRSEILQTPGPISDYRIKWVELPQDPFNGTSIGAVILEPTKNATQRIMLCNLSAAWGSSSLNISSFPAASGTNVATSSIVDTSFNLPRARDYGQNQADSVITYDLPLFPQRLINIRESWARYLNPIDPVSNRSVLSSLMEVKLIHKNDTTSAAIMLAGLLANGLSRIGLDGQLQGDLRTVTDPVTMRPIADGAYWFAGKGDIFKVDPQQAKDWVKLRVQSAAEGYAYSISGLAPKVTITILLVYCFLTVLHLFYTTLTGISSTSWDSISEFMVLAVNSSPTEKLRNTCAGIISMNIYKLPVRVLTSRDEADEDEHLELVFGSVDEGAAKKSRISENRRYGTMLGRGWEHEAVTGRSLPCEYTPRRSRCFQDI